VKIKGIDKRNDREFMVEQVIDAGGSSPWDGQPFSVDYAVTLVNALREAEDAGNRLELALQTIADLHPDFSLDEASIIGPLKASLDRLGKNLVKQG
jgi:hypothetical protein